MVNMSMFYIKKDESTAARRRVPVYLVDATDGYTPETGVAAPTIEVSKNGAAQGAGAGSWAEIGDGNYYYEFTAGEVDTLGWVELRVVKSGTSREYNCVAHITAYDAYASTNLGLSYLSGSVALDSTVAKEATLNTKIPTALSFTGANVNAESKVTAAPSDMALNSTVAKDATVAKEATLNTKIPTALSFTGANVNAESKVTAAPSDMALNSTVAKDATVAKDSTVAKEATLNTKIPTNLSFTGANVNAESKVTAAPSDMALNSTVAKDATVAKDSTVAKDATVSKSAGVKGTDATYDEVITHPTLAEIEASTALAKRTGAKGTDEIHDDVALITGFALDSTVAKEATLNTKIPTALSFTGANVNAESKVTAAPSDMALNSTVAKDSTVSKAAGGKGTDAIYDDVITHPTLAEILAGGVALDSTVAKSAGLKGTDAIYDDVITHPTLAEIEASTIIAKQTELIRALGLMQENQYIDQVVYTLGKVTSMRLRTYDLAINVGTVTGVLATYTITSQYTGDSLDWFKVVKV